MFNGLNNLIKKRKMRKEIRREIRREEKRRKKSSVIYCDKLTYYDKFSDERRFIDNSGKTR